MPLASILRTTACRKRPRGVRGGAQSEERRGSLCIRHHHRETDGEYRYVQRFGDEQFCVKSAVAHQRIERPLVSDGGHVLVVILDLAHEELVQLERDQLGTFERGAPGTAR